MIFQYTVPGKFLLDRIPLQFGLSRDLVRAKLGGGHEAQNEEISLGDGDPAIVRRRDIYNRLDSTGAHFFLCYNSQDLLTEVEIRRCKRIKIFGLEFNFRDEAELIAEELSGHSPLVRKSDGEYFFPELQLMLIDEKHMGGWDSNMLDCFYYAADTSHLH